METHSEGIQRRRCPSTLALERYWAGELQPGARLEMNLHVHDCARCSGRVASIGKSDRRFWRDQRSISLLCLLAAVGCSGTPKVPEFASLRHPPQAVGDAPDTSERF